MPRCYRSRIQTWTAVSCCRYDFEIRIDCARVLAWNGIRTQVYSLLQETLQRKNSTTFNSRQFVISWSWELPVLQFEYFFLRFFRFNQVDLMITY